MLYLAIYLTGVFVCSIISRLLGDSDESNAIAAVFWPVTFPIALACYVLIGILRAGKFVLKL
jgi:hypothetical protein